VVRSGTAHHDDFALDVFGREPLANLSVRVAPTRASVVRGAELMPEA